jgi:hypothetical protein
MVVEGAEDIGSASAAVITIRKVLRKGYSGSSAQVAPSFPSADQVGTDQVVDKAVRHATSAEEKTVSLKTVSLEAAACFRVGPNNTSGMQTRSKRDGLWLCISRL